MAAVIHPDDIVVMKENLQEQLKCGNTIHNENRLIRKDGEIVWISIQAQLFTEEDGEHHFYCVFVDITEEKLLQDRVRELHEKELTYFADMSLNGGSIRSGLRRQNQRRNETEQKMQEIRGLTLYTMVKNIHILKYRTNIRICSVLF